MGFDFAAQWHVLAEDVISGLAEWRRQHPRATFCEIGQAVDERLAQMRARMLQDAALASTAADIQGAAAEVRPVRPPCGVRLESRGTAVRERITQHNQTVRLTRSYGVCPQYGAGLFPLDEELALLPGALTPNLHEDLVRLGGVAAVWPGKRRR